MGGYGTNLAGYQVFCLYIFLLNCVSLNNFIVDENNFGLINENRYVMTMFYTSLVYYLVWIFFDLFAFSYCNRVKTERTPNSVYPFYALPYILVYNNLFLLLNPDTSYALYLLYHKILWLFTAPYIIYIYTQVYRINNYRPFFTEIALHIINLFKTFNNLYYLSSNVMMYCLYLYNLYQFTTFKYPANIMLMYSWFTIGVVETLYMVSGMKDDTYIIFLLLNDIQIKVLVFVINVFKYWQVSTISNSVNIQDTKVLYTIRKNLDKLQNPGLLQYTDFINSFDLLLEFVDKGTMIDDLKKQSGTHRYSQDFVLDLVKKDYKEVENIVVLFTDIVNYSGFSMNHKPGYVITFLQKLYSIYDSMLQKYKTLQKIENVGDCYMVTSCLSNSKMSEDKLINICVDMFKFAQDVTMLTNKIKMDTRIGINIGNVSIGIVGNQIPRICVVGHEVNYTSRLESTCQFNCIQVSESFHMRISSAISKEIMFDCLLVYMKNIGEEKTYSYKGPFFYDSKFINNHSVEIAQLMSMVKKSNNIMKKNITEPRRHTYSSSSEFKRYSVDKSLAQSELYSLSQFGSFSHGSETTTDDKESSSQSDILDDTVKNLNTEALAQNTLKLHEEWHKQRHIPFDEENFKV